jgi:hypothetical protein
MRRTFILMAIFAATLTLQSCEALPKRGFLTAALGGPHGDVLRDIFEPSSTFSGQPVRSQGPAPLPANGPIDKCELVARERAQDAFSQGQDEDVQRKVYEFTLKDCHAWSSRY